METFFRAFFGAIAWGVAMLMLAMLSENIAQIRKGEIINRGHAVGLIVAPSIVLIACAIVIITMVVQK